MIKEQISTLVVGQFEDEVIEAYIEIVGEDYATAEGLEESYQGYYNSDEEFVQSLLEDAGEIPELPLYIHIDWETTARDVMMDYSEHNGYYFRNL